MTTPTVDRKHCPQCGETKPITRFYKDIHAKYGVTTYCIDCQKTRSIKYRASNPEKIRQRKNNYYQNNRATLTEKATHLANIYQQNTKQAATIPTGTPYTPIEDAFLTADNGMTVEQKALHLGRTYSSCVGRIRRLRRKTA